MLDGSSLEVAPRLLGAVIRHGAVSVRLTEVEAYAGEQDPGSHAFNGPTPRNQVMFGPSGHLYCYFVYGMHVCANVVVGPPGDPAAVLLRAGEVVDGHQAALQNRPGARHHDLARGPARLCRALGIRLQHNGCDLQAGPILLEVGERHPDSAIASGPRVGLRRAPDRPWRFWLDGHPSVSAYRPAAPLKGPS